MPHGMRVATNDAPSPVSIRVAPSSMSHAAACKLWLTWMERTSDNGLVFRIRLLVYFATTRIVVRNRNQGFDCGKYHSVSEVR